MELKLEKQNDTESECERNCVLPLPLQLGSGSGHMAATLHRVKRRPRSTKKSGGNCQGRGNGAK